MSSSSSTSSAAQSVWVVTLTTYSEEAAEIITEPHVFIDKVSAETFLVERLVVQLLHITAADPDDVTEFDIEYTDDTPDDEKQEHGDDIVWMQNLDGKMVLKEKQRQNLGLIEAELNALEEAADFDGPLRFSWEIKEMTPITYSQRKLHEIAPGLPNKRKVVESDDEDESDSSDEDEADVVAAPASAKKQKK